MRVRARYAYRKEHIPDWFAAHRLAPPRWPLADVAALAFEDAAGGAVRGYAVYAWAAPGVMQVHVAADAALRGRWSRGVIGDFHRFPYILGAGCLATRARTPGARRALRQLGWRPASDDRFETPLPNEWSRYRG